MCKFWYLKNKNSTFNYKTTHFKFKYFLMFWLMKQIRTVGNVCVYIAILEQGKVFSVTIYNVYSFFLIFKWPKMLNR